MHMRKIWTIVSMAILVILATRYSQGGDDKSQRFDLMETTIDKVHAAYKSGKLTAH